jgi:preprotein translocase subunit SecA
MFEQILRFFFKTSHERQIRKIQPRVAAINELESKIKGLSDEQLKAKTAEFRQKLDNGATLDSLLVEAFAVCREGGRRALGMRHYDVQLIGGIVLHEGKIAEMKTGEGKTLVATLACYLNALEGKGVHVVTVNDYLARRDAEWMGRLYNFLGLSVGVIVPQQRDVEKKAAYRADITYGQNNEFGFDYLRDNMKFSIHDYAQRELNFAIVDEVDSILVDEARTPLIISGEGHVASEKYVKIAAVMPRLRKDEHYQLDEKNHSVALTEEGIELAQRLFAEKGLIEGKNLFDPVNLESLHILQQSLRASTLYKRDQHYMVTPDQKVVIVDEFTGRVLAGRRWSDGLHQAVEAKEGVAIQAENRTVATISFQNLFRLYKKLSGMTGTADTEASEFHKIYNLDVVVIPTNKSISRKDADDLVFKTEREKFKAVCEDILDCHQNGQPVLVGTTSVEKSEALAKVLEKHSVPFHVLNAKQHEREAYIVAQAGRKGSVTIATNMAGRGTDILLGGNPEMLARFETIAEAQRTGDAALLQDKAALEAAIKTKQGELEKLCAAEKKEVLSSGGLQIIGTERHESRRIDNQLRGRAGRQGDPGASRFYLSLEDDLMRIFAGDRIQSMMETLGMEEGVPIEHRWVTQAVENAQKKVEERNFDVRKNLLDYDDVMNQQRKTIYALRRQVLEGQYRTVPSDEERKQGILPQPIAKETRADYKKRVEGVLEQMIKLHGANDAPPPLPPVGARPEEMEAYRFSVEEWRKVALAASLGSQKLVRPSIERELYDRFGCRISTEKLSKEPRKLLEFLEAEVALSLTEQKERLLDLIDSLVGSLMERHAPPDKHFEDWDLDALARSFKAEFGIEATGLSKYGDASDLAHRLFSDAEAVLEKKEKESGPENFLRAFRTIYLREIDRQWLEHLTTMEQLRDGIGLRAWGQRDPKKEYKKEGYEIFVAMMTGIKATVAQQIFRLEVLRDEDVRRLEEMRRRDFEAQQQRMRMGAPSAGAAAQAPAGALPAGALPGAQPGQPMRLTAAQVQALQKLAQERGLRLEIRPAGGSPSLPPEARPSAAGAGAVIPANAPLRVPTAPKATPASAAPAAARPSGAPERAPAAPKAETVRRDKPKVGRNDPCWCGSGKKYKSCHMKADERGAEPAADAAGDASDDAG